MTGRGRRAALPEGGHARPEYLVADEQGSLVVRHYNRHDEVREYDFSELPVAGPMQASLAAVFAARCTPGRLSTHVTSETYWIRLRQFGQFLARQQPPPRDLDELTPRMIQQWRAGLPPGGGYNAFRILGGMLRQDARLQAGPVADELARYYKIPRSRVQSYSEAEFDRVTAVARRQFRAALRRIIDNSIHLQRWRDGELAAGSTNWVIGEGLDIIARTGDLPRYGPNKYGSCGVKGSYRDACRQAADPPLWQRLFLMREEATALGVLLLASMGGTCL